MDNTTSLPRVAAVIALWYISGVLGVPGLVYRVFQGSIGLYGVLRGCATLGASFYAGVSLLRRKRQAVPAFAAVVLVSVVAVLLNELFDRQSIEAVRQRIGENGVILYYAITATRILVQSFAAVYVKKLSRKGTLD